MNLELGRGGDRTSGVISILNLVLADECLLYSRIRNLHANLPRTGCDVLRRLLGEQFDELTSLIDRLVERVRGVGGQGLRTMSEFLQYTEPREPRIKSGPPGHLILRRLISQHESLMQTLSGDVNACSQDYDDAQSAELLENIIACHQRMRAALVAFRAD